MGFQRVVNGVSKGCHRGVKGVPKGCQRSVERGCRRGVEEISKGIHRKFSFLWNFFSAGKVLETPLTAEFPVGCFRRKLSSLSKPFYP